MDRREFLLSVGAAGAALAFPFGARAEVTAPPPPARPRGVRSVYVDAQGALDGFDEPEPGRYVPTERLLAAIGERRIDVISATIGDVGNGPDRFRGAAQAGRAADR